MDRRQKSRESWAWHNIELRQGRYQEDTAAEWSPCRNTSSPTRPGFRHVPEAFLEPGPLTLHIWTSSWYGPPPGLPTSLCFSRWCRPEPSWLLFVLNGDVCVCVWVCVCFLSFNPILQLLKRFPLGTTIQAFQTLKSCLCRGRGVVRTHDME